MIIEFFIACIITGLEYIHSQKIIHRDIKPENLVLDDKGYVRITDFGIAKSFSNYNAKETSGTPGYMAPEVMKGQNHTYAVDFFALGIMGYEFMLGRRPYNGRSRREIKEQMLSKNVQISLGDLPNGWSEDAGDFFNKLLQRKPDLRLGYRGIKELKQHQWLKYFPWDSLLKKELISPFIPEKRDNFDKKYCEANDSINIETKIRYEKYKGDVNYEQCFRNFTFYRIITEQFDDKKDETSINNNIAIIKQDNNIKNDLPNIKNSTDEITTINNHSNKDLHKNIIKEDVVIKRQNTNNPRSPNKVYNLAKMPNISMNNNLINLSLSMKLFENDNENNNKNENNAINNKDKNKNNDLKNGKTPKQSISLKNNDILHECSDSLQKRINKTNKTDKSNKNKNHKLNRSKTPMNFAKNRIIVVESNSHLREKNKSHSKSIGNNKNNNKLRNKNLIINQNQYNNYKENIRNLFSKRAIQKMSICTPGYYSKHSLQINCSNKFNNVLVKRNSNPDYSRTPNRSLNSFTKSPKITTSTSNSIQGYKKICRSVSPLNRSKKYLRQSNSAVNIHKNFVNERNKSRINLNSLYNQNFSYVKRIKEMNSFNYSNNKMTNNVRNVRNNGEKKTNEIISSYNISSSNILKQIKKTNYNKIKNNYKRKNNPLFLYNHINVNQNQRMKQNNKISLELELNADSQTFSKHNKVQNNNKNDNKSKNRKANSNICIKNNIMNRNHSTINISSMKMAMNGNININVVIKGNNNTTNLINKIEVKKKNGENDLKNKCSNNKKFTKSNSERTFKLKI